MVLPLRGLIIASVFCICVAITLLRCHLLLLVLATKSLHAFRYHCCFCLGHQVVIWILILVESIKLRWKLRKEFSAGLQHCGNVAVLMKTLKASSNSCLIISWDWMLSLLFWWPSCLWFKNYTGCIKVFVQFLSSIESGVKYQCYFS